jgi:hypothetical protein
MFEANAIKIVFASDFAGTAQPGRRSAGFGNRLSRLRLISSAADNPSEILLSGDGNAQRHLNRSIDALSPNDCHALIVKFTPQVKQGWLKGDALFARPDLRFARLERTGGDFHPANRKFQIPRLASPLNHRHRWAKVALFDSVDRLPAYLQRPRCLRRADRPQLLSDEFCRRSA